MFLLSSRQKARNPLQRLGNRLIRGREAEPHVTLAMAAETGAGNGGDPGFFQQAVLDLAGGQAGAGDVGEGIEGALGADAADAGDRKSVVSGKSVSVRVDLGGRRIIKQKKQIEHNHNLKDRTNRTEYMKEDSVIRQK